MAIKYNSVKEACQDLAGKRNGKGKLLINRFNKKKFNALMIAMANEPEFKEKVVKKVDADTGEIDYEEVMVTKGFRKWCKYLLQTAGVDKLEAERVMTTDFKIDNVDGLYEFFVSALYQYMVAGNRFDFLGKNDFAGGIEIKEVDAQTKTTEARSPQTGESLGTYETTKEAHKEVKSKTPAPKWLTKKKKVK